MTYVRKSLLLLLPLLLLMLLKGACLLCTKANKQKYVAKKIPLFTYIKINKSQIQRQNKDNDEMMSRADVKE